MGLGVQDSETERFFSSPGGSFQSSRLFPGFDFRAVGCSVSGIRAAGLSWFVVLFSLLIRGCRMQAWC